MKSARINFGQPRSEYVAEVNDQGEAISFRNQDTDTEYIGGGSGLPDISAGDAGKVLTVSDELAAEWASNVIVIDAVDTGAAYVNETAPSINTLLEYYLSGKTILIRVLNTDHEPIRITQLITFEYSDKRFHSIAVEDIIYWEAITSPDAPGISYYYD